MRSGDRLDEDDVHLFFGDGIVPHAARHHGELTRTQLDVLAPLDLYPQVPRHDEEHLVFVLVGVPHQLAEELGDFDVLIVHPPHDTGCPVLRHLVELGGDVYGERFGHGYQSRRFRAASDNGDRRDSAVDWVAERGAARPARVDVVNVVWDITGGRDASIELLGQAERSIRDRVPGQEVEFHPAEGTVDALSAITAPTPTSS
jgi:hypothetical protein